MNIIRLQLSEVTQTEGRKIRGVAYSGAVLNYHGENIAIDLDSLQLSARPVPLLHLHDVNSVVGQGYLSREENQLVITGTLHDNDKAAEIAKTADGGFPWQLSVQIHSGTVERIRKGDLVNGVPLSVDEAHLFMNGQIREVSFTPLGVDANTSVAMLSLFSTQQEENTLDIKELQLSITAKDEEIAALKQELLAERTAKLSALGVSDTNAAIFAQLDKPAFTALVAELSEKQKTAQLSAAQNAVLGTQYGDAAQPRENPLLKLK